MTTLEKSTTPTPYRWTRAAFQKMQDAGIWPDDGDVAFRDGRIVGADGTPVRWTTDAYDAVIAQGGFPPDAHVQLLHGTVYEMSPQGPSHALSIDLVTDELRRQCPSTHFVTSQRPVDLAGASMPEPDVALVPGEPRDYTAAHPTTARLVVEVADTSLAFDRTVKAGIYARADIPAYWIVNLSEQAVEVYTEPEKGGYSTVQRYRPNESVPFDEADPIPVASMLP